MKKAKNPEDININRATLKSNKSKSPKINKSTRKIARKRSSGEPIVLEFNLSKTVAIITTIIFILSAILTTKIVQTIIVAKEEKTMASTDESANGSANESTGESADESTDGSADESTDEHADWVESKTKTSYTTPAEVDYEKDENGNKTETPITVPVPEGYTASEVIGETSRDTGFVIYEGDINWNNYIDASEYSSEAPSSTISLKSNTNDTTQWILLDDGTYASGYKTSDGNIYGSYNIDSTTNILETEEFILIASETVTFDWAVSSETSDYLYYVIINTKTNETVETSTRISGTTSGTNYSELSFVTETIDLEAGTYKIEFVYVKDSSSSSGLDAGFVKNIKISSELEIPIFVIDTTATYHWSQYDDGTYVSGYSGSGGNYNVDNSTNELTSNEFTIEETATLKFDWTVSSESSWDYLYYTITNTSTGTTTGGTSTKISGTGYGSSYDSLTFNEVSVSLEAGTYTVKFSYYKNGLYYSGLDAGFVKNIRVEQDGANLTGYDNRDICGKSGTYHWSEYEEEVWTSGYAKEGTVYGNYNINNSTSTVETEEFTLEKPSKVTFDWAVSSEDNDYLYYTITGSNSEGTSVTKGGTSTKISGTTSGTSYSELNYSTETNYLDAGTYKIEFVYVKDSSSSSGLDAGFVKDIQSVQACTETDKNIFNLQKTVNQYVWVPIDDISEICGIDSTGKLWGKLYSSYGGTSRSKTKLNWSETNGVMKITSMASSTSSNREPDVTKYYNNYDEDNRLAGYSLGQTKYEMLAKEQEKEFYNAMESIEKYGGFYIGRYETGGLQTSTAVVQKMQSDTSISSITWYKMYEKCQKLSGTNSNVGTSMIWGSLWDATLDWFVDSKATTSTYNGQLEDGKRGITITNTYLTNYSSAKYLGNYYYATFTYIKSGAEYPVYTETKAVNTRTNLPTGCSDFTKINNIYDMGGNMYDWTLEAGYSNVRFLRGGYWDSGPRDYPSGRGGVGPSASNTGCGCRVVLYIK